ncbi:MAG: peptidoglycan recognition family protein [Planctomycetota bacterium]|nr:peptidoglycan recognition family protein [Planctomycetota bacterium]MDP6762861.1 peptidoglycan recognition family protein [Planctomycetota bacterium]MDP6988739.1 peptidoglycan recognition family protein [Planctomycetota bacterium]
MSARREDAARAGSRSGPTGGRPLTAPCALVLCALAAACTGGAGPTRGSSGPWPGPVVPAWVGEPLTWSKLDAIEAWLIDAGDAEPFWRLTAELTLAEGRLDISAGESAAAVGAPPLRHAAARAGFEGVAADPAASDDQRRRALAGLARLDELGVAAPPAPGERISRARWGATAAVPSRLDPVGGPWTRITVHHSAEVPGATLDGSIADSTLALRKIQRVHVHQRAFGDVGYHFLVDAAGRVFEGRSLRWQGAHAGGILNRGNLGICLLGDFRHRSPTAAALSSLARLLDDLRAEHGLSATTVVGHSDLKQTLCPGASLSRWVAVYRGGGPAERARGSSHRGRGLPAVGLRPASAPRAAGVVQ